MMASLAKIFAFAPFIALYLVFGVSNRTWGGEPTVRADRFGDPLPKDALVRIGARPFRVEGYTQSVAFSPDGKWLAAGDYNGLVYLWDAASGKVIRKIDARERGSVVFFSRDCKLLGTRTAQGEVQLWEPNSGRRLASFHRQVHGNEYYHEQLLVSSDATRLIVVGDANRMIAVHNGKHADSYVIGDKPPELSIDLLEPGGKLVKQLAKNTADTVFSDVALSPDGKLLAVGIRAFKAPRKLLRLIDATTGELVREIKGEGEGWFLSVAFTQDGQTLALGSKDEMTLVEVATGKLLDQIAEKMSTIGFLGFGPDAKTLISHSHDNKVRLWDVAAKKILKQFDADSDGYFVLPLPGKFGQPAINVEHFSKSNHTALSPDGKTIAVGISGCVQFWDVFAGKQLVPDQKSAVGWGNVAFSPDGQLLLHSNWKHSHLCDSETGEVHKELPAWTILGAFSPDGKHLAFTRYYGEDTKEAPTAIIWDIAKGVEVSRLEHPRMERFSFEKLAFGPDGRSLLTLSSHVEDAGYPNCTMVHRWDTRTGKLLSKSHRQNTNAWPSAIAPDGRTAAIVLDRGLLLTDVENDEDLWTRIDGMPDGWGGYPAFSPDGGFLFAWSNCDIVMWENATRSVIARLSLRRDGNLKLAKWPVPDKDSKGEPELAFNQPKIEALVVSPDCRFVATSENYQYGPRRTFSNKPMPMPAIRIWEAATGKVVQTLEGFRARCTSMAFSADGRRLASAFHNDTALVWDVSQTTRPAGKNQKLSPDQLQKLWTDLALENGATAYSVICTMQNAPEETVEFLKRHLRPIPMSAATNVQRLIQSLGSNQFAEREASTKELARLTAQFRVTLRNTLKNPTSLEVQRRP